MNRRIAAAIRCFLFFLFPTVTYAISAQWDLDPISGDWHTAANWTPNGVPNGPADIATFGLSNTTDVSISEDTEVNGIIFTADATNSYAIDLFTSNPNKDVTLTISGSGITNNSGIIPYITAYYPYYGAEIVFRGNASASNATIATVGNAYVAFYNSSTAGSAQLYGGNDETYLDFYDASTAGNSAISYAGTISFHNYSSAGSADVSISGLPTGGEFSFDDSSSAGSARISIYGNDNYADVRFMGSSTGDTAQIELFSGEGYGQCSLFIDGHNPPGVRIGSLAGDEPSFVYLGSNNLTIGSNSLNTTFAGAIVGDGGSLTKTGSGKLTLTNANPYSGSTYTGGTTIRKGVLIVNNTTGSATGTGPVQVISGTLSGTGIIDGPVTVGNGTTTGAIVRGGSGPTAGTLTINSSLTFNSQSTYKCYLNRTTPPRAGTVKALGVTINANVPFTWVETGRAALARGTRFTVIDNTSANPIFGRFSNLPDNSTFTDTHGTTFKVRYAGGTGNDLVLTVIQQLAGSL
jgi:autotransporter-associated beta strand protein